MVYLRAAGLERNINPAQPQQELICLPLGDTVYELMPQNPAGLAGLCVSHGHLKQTEAGFDF